MSQKFCPILLAAVFFFSAWNSHAQNVPAFRDTALEKFSSPVIEPATKPEAEAPAPAPRLKKRVPLVPADADSPAPTKAPEAESAASTEGDLPSTDTDTEEPKKDPGPPPVTYWHYMPAGSSSIAYESPAATQHIHAPKPEPTFSSVAAKAGLGKDSATRISYFLHSDDVGETGGNREQAIAKFCEKISRDGKECHRRIPYPIVETLLTLGEFCLSLERNNIECSLKDPLTLVLIPVSKSNGSDISRMSLRFERFRDSLLLKKVDGPGQTVFEGADAGKFLLMLAAPFL